ncbi:hypothetical protein BC937DRAFT_90964 [Endogone sp. FLAS-F59071]|nr:hypothetical protein BC937DRAFT_90964 [Endogone sp. FLAS-F59071]|eukprot:RUS16650.1 hypothetical protein BC937DRAFT_90964 [Endogone sp. FLAS-F59071]
MSRRNDHPRPYLPLPTQPFQMFYTPPPTQPPPRPSNIPNEGQCPHCPDDLGSRERLMEHIVREHPPRRPPRPMRVPTCEQCGATFNTANSLASHRSRYRNHGSPTVVEEPVPRGIEGHTCVDCGRFYKSLKTLKAHRRKKHPVEPEQEREQEREVYQQQQPQLGSSVASPQQLASPQPPGPQLPPPQVLEPRELVILAGHMLICSMGYEGIV